MVNKHARGWVCVERDVQHLQGWPCPRSLDDAAIGEVAQVAEHAAIAHHGLLACLVAVIGRVRADEAEDALQQPLVQPAGVVDAGGVP